MFDNNLIIVGAGVYSLVVKEIAESMGCFGNIAFADENVETTQAGYAVLCKICDIEKYRDKYPNAIVAIGRSDVRLSLLEHLRGAGFTIATIISPKAYISPSARVMEGSVIEPLAVVHTGAVIKEGCLISAGAVVNHLSVCERGVHVDCNATVAGNKTVPKNTKIPHNSAFFG